MTSSEPPASFPRPAEGHGNEGFLKAAWHKLTHHDNNVPPEERSAGSKDDHTAPESEPKKAASSG